MTNPIPYMSSGQPLGFTNQKPMLIFIGIVLICIGAFFGCIAGAMPISLFMVSRSMPGANVNVHATTLLMGLVVYALLAAGLIWGGVGAILARRWIRPIFIILSTLAVVLGIVTLIGGVISTTTMANTTFQTSVIATSTGPTSAQVTSVAVTRAQGMALFAGLAVVVLFMIVLPAGLLWFMRLPSVRQTIEHYDPHVRWTDKRPFPVLAIALSCWIWALTNFSQTAGGITIYFGAVFRGIPGVLMSLLMAAAGVVTGYLVWRQSAIGWWMAVLLCIALTISSILTSLLVRVGDLVAAMDLPAESVEQVRASAGDSSVLTALYVAVLMVPAVMYLYRQRRFFVSGVGADFDGSASAPPQA
jgi:hypothetical protein